MKSKRASNITGTLQQQGTYFYMVEYTEKGTVTTLKGISFLNINR